MGVLERIPKGLSRRILKGGPRRIPIRVPEGIWAFLDAFKETKASAIPRSIPGGIREAVLEAVLPVFL